MTKKIIFSAGGTGGHILPAINLMKHFFEKGYNVVLVTDKRGNNFLNRNSKFKSYELRTGTPTSKNLIAKILSLIIIFFSVNCGVSVDSMIISGFLSKDSFFNSEILFKTSYKILK